MGIKVKPTIFQKLQQGYPKENIVDVAIKTLEDKVEISEFFTEYLKALRQKDKTYSKKQAQDNIISIAAYYVQAEEILEVWKHVLFDLKPSKK